MSATPLFRPRDGRMIAGVCAGIARRFGWDPVLVRVIFVLFLFLPGSSILAYLILWIVMPDENRMEAPTNWQSGPPPAA
ncbi:MAG: PspC domain-containing protein [Sporichthyaceae bacterium]|nr:PspC domain-containing protein [Sporichthyaceae bacterium]